MSCPTYKSESPSAIGAPPSFNPENLGLRLDGNKILILNGWDGDHSASSFCFKPDLDYNEFGQKFCIIQYREDLQKPKASWGIVTDFPAKFWELGSSRARRASWGLVTAHPYLVRKKTACFLGNKVFRVLHRYLYIYIFISIIQKTCASGIWKITTGRYDDGDDGTTTMCRRPDDDSSAARRRCADGTTVIDRRHDDCLTTWRRCDDSATTVTSPSLTCHKPGYKPGFGAEPGLMTCHKLKLGLDAEPKLMTVVAPSSHRRGIVVMSSSCRCHAVSLSSSCRRHIVVRSSSCCRRAVVVT